MTLPPRRRLQLHAVVGRAADDGGQEVRLAQEVGHEPVGRPVVELSRPAGLHDLAVAQDRDGVGHGQGLLLVVRDVDGGDPCL
ncbi:MAG: hypothetical protein ACYTGC_13405 [Planctomycetota bacterium]